MNDGNLQMLAEERQALLQRAIAVLQDDERVVAAWLYGSLARAAADEWSDIDLWVVVADDYIGAIRAARREYVAALGEPLLIVDAPQNAPPGGAFLSVVYRSRVASQHVDWTWQRQSDARVPHDARLLFDRVDLPRNEPPPALLAEKRTRKASEQVAYFWFMVPIVAKYVARKRAWEVVSLLNLLRHALEEVGELTERIEGARVEASSSTLPPPAHLTEQLAMLREMAHDMEQLMAQVPSLQSVSPEAREQVYRHLDLAESASN